MIPMTMNNNNGRLYNVTDEQWHYPIHSKNNEQQYKITINNDYTGHYSKQGQSIVHNGQCTTIIMHNIYNNNAQ